MAVTGIDDKLERRARAALAKSPFYELRALSVEQRDNSLWISGGVSRFYYKQLAQEVVRSVDAEITVVNSVRVEPEEEPR
jgi:osmotically-inducible protein OsmY